MRGGSWISPPESAVRVRVSVAVSGGLSLEVDGRALNVSQRQVSPDRQTTLLWWQGGEGVLICQDGDTVSASLFDRTIPVRQLTLIRPAP